MPQNQTILWRSISSHFFRILNIISHFSTPRQIYVLQLDSVCFSGVHSFVAVLFPGGLPEDLMKSEF